MTFFKPDDFEKTMVEDGIGKPYQTITVTASNTIDLNAAKYKYAEGQIISDLKAYIDKILLNDIVCRYQDLVYLK